VEHPLLLGMAPLEPIKTHLRVLRYCLVVTRGLFQLDKEQQCAKQLETGFQIQLTLCAQVSYLQPWDENEYTGYICQQVEQKNAVAVSFSLRRVGKDCIVQDSYQTQLCKDAEGADMLKFIIS